MVEFLFGLAFAFMALVWAYVLSSSNPSSERVWRVLYPWPRWYPGFMMKLLTVSLFIGLFLALVGLVRLVIALF